MEVVEEEVMEEVEEEEEEDDRVINRAATWSPGPVLQQAAP